MAVVRAPEFPKDATWLFPAACPVAQLEKQRQFFLRELRGRVVVLDFWTYGCINCLHVLPELAELERCYGDRITLLGIHSAKFDWEAQPEAVQQAMERYGIGHPVLCDRDLEVWQQYAVRAWPTVVVIDPRGYIAGQFVGEGRRAELFALVEQLLGDTSEETELAGLESETLEPEAFEPEPGRSHSAIAPEPTSLSPALPPATDLRFPGKLCIAQPTDADQPYLFIADSSHHRIVVATLTGRVIRVIGNGLAGWRDGAAEQAQFCYPQGLVWDRAAQRLYVADSGSHTLRAVELFVNRVTTLAGTGVQSRIIHPHGGQARAVALNSPWDLVLCDRHLFIAMAGSHQIWWLNLDTGHCQTYAGSGAEGWADGELLRAAFAQPSGLATDGRELFVADAESSSIRAVGLGDALGDVPNGDAPQVRTVCGSGMLFGWGDRDGQGEAVRLQHCLGLAYAADGSAGVGWLWVADTYNHRLKRVNPATGQCKTWGETWGETWLDTERFGAQAGEKYRFSEPSGLASAQGKLWVADCNNHRIAVVDLAQANSQTDSQADSRIGWKGGERSLVRSLDLKFPPAMHNSPLPHQASLCTPDGCFD